jgi:hypothetical protein
MLTTSVMIDGRAWGIEISKGPTLLNPATFQLETTFRILVKTDCEGVSETAPDKLRGDLASAVERAMKEFV